MDSASSHEVDDYARVQDAIPAISETGDGFPSQCLMAP